MPKINKSKIVVIVGPNASGKSALAVKIAKKINGEIISADSRQVYRGMDIGTGKITRKEMRGVPHHLLDVVSPKTNFNVSHFKKLAAQKIREIIGRGKTPIIVGGTGFWIDALIYDWPIPEVGPDPALRARLENMTVEKIFGRLKKIDPARAKTIDRHNKRRLIRALEIGLSAGSKLKKFNIVSRYNRTPKYDFLVLGINLPQRKLEKRIRRRLLGWFKAGLLKEIKKLHDPPTGGGHAYRQAGVSWKRLDNFGLEYRFGSRYLRGLISYDEMLEQTYRAIRQYAKRQMRWFKRNPQIFWIKNTKQALAKIKSN